MDAKKTKYYNFYFENGNRANVLKLADCAEKVQSVSLLAVTTKGSNVLLRWPENIYLATTEGTAKDIKAAYLQSVSQNGNDIDIVLGDSKKTVKMSCTDFELSSSGQMCTLNRSHPAADNMEICTVHICYRHKAKAEKGMEQYQEYKGDVIMHCVPSGQIYSVVLDFGSEASQMLVTEFAADTGVESYPVLENALRHYYNVSQVVGDRVYDQQDTNKKLFRSIFYSKKNAVLKDNDPATFREFLCQPPCRDGIFLNFLSRRVDYRGGRIPNIKLSYLTGTTVNGVADISTLHKGVVLRFFHEALKRIEDIKKNDKPIAVAFKILLPNVMQQKAVSLFIKEIREIVNCEQFKNNGHEALGLAFTDVTCVSESDASFLYYMRERGQHNINPGKKYLTIDVGKGTTDFSVIKVVNGNTAISETRGGFIGAGNAISYAIFKTYVRAMVDSDDGVKPLMHTILSAEPALLFELENTIEDYKRNWRQDVKKPTNFKPVNRVMEKNAESLLDTIQQMGHIGDVYGYVGEIIGRIATNVLKLVPVKTVDYVLFSGRAFLFDSLRASMEAAITQYNRQIKVMEYNKSAAKNGCLFGPLDGGTAMNSQSLMVGMPEMRSGLADYCDSLKHPILEKDTKKKIDQQTVWDEHWRRFVNLFHNFNIGGGSSDDDEVSPSRTTVMDSSVRNCMTRGMEIKKVGPNPFIKIAGNIYMPVGGYDIRTSGVKYYFYFDGESFYLKFDKGCKELKMNIIKADDELLEESLFPYSLKKQN